MDSLLKKEMASAAANLDHIRRSLDSDGGTLEKACRMITSSLGEGGKVLVAGNGGSAADAQHFAAELVGRYRRDRKGLAAIALTTDTSALTAIGNDYGFASVFSRQVEALGKEGDVFIGISTSGSSRNVVAAVRTAAKAGLRTIVLAGGDGGEAAREAELSLVFPSKDTPRIQEYHSIILHIIAAVAEESAQGGKLG